VIVLGACSPAGGQKISRDEAMLAKVYLKYRSLNNLSQRLKGSMKVNAGGTAFTATFSADTKMARPSQFRSEVEIDFIGMMTRGLSVTDGKTLWDYDPHAGQYAEQPLAAAMKSGNKDGDWIMDRAGMDFPLMLFMDTTKGKLFNVKPGAEKSVEVKNYPVKVVDGLPMHIVRVPIPAEKGAKPGAAFLYVGVKDMLIRRCRFNMKAPGGKPGQSMNVEFVCFYSRITPDFAPAVDTFTFTPPENAQKLPKLGPAFARAFEGPPEPRP